MSKNIKIVCAIAATLLIPVVGYASDDRDNDRDHAQVYLKDSTITSEIKAQFAEEHVKGLAHVHVDTDDHGVVKLTGHVRSQEQMDMAVSIARNMLGVREIKNEMRVKLDD